MHTAPAINRNRQTEFNLKHLAVATLGLAGLLATGVASAGTIELWTSASRKPAGYSRYTSGSMTNPAGSYNTYWHATVSDPDFPGTFQIKATGYTTANSNGTGSFAQRDLAMYAGGLGVCEDSPCPASPQHAVDNDGRNEMIVTTRGDGGSEGIASERLGHVYRYDVYPEGGTRKELLVDFSEEHVESSWPAVGDVDGDGRNEIILATGSGDRRLPGRSWLLLLRRP